MWDYQFAEALHASSHLNLDRFATMQEHYSLAHREAERELLPLCNREEIGVIPWSPLGRGYLTRPHENFETTTRATTDQYAQQIEEGTGSSAINERVEELATQHGVSMAQIALAWLLHKEWVTAPIIGTTSVEHLEDAVEAVELSLSTSDIAYLEEPYEPMAIMGQIE
jgi:aryl-alcohol dehydrogenase-like predicted oxidoreductase